MMQLSYWDRQTWLNGVDYAVVGSGIVGLQTAIHLKKSHPKAKVIILERGSMPQGASTKNAGFACFGSVSELLSDLKTFSETEVLDLVAMRWEGLRLLRQTLQDFDIEYEQLGGFEVFRSSDSRLYNECLEAIPELNDRLAAIFKRPVYEVQRTNESFSGVFNRTIYNQFEGQINTGFMMQSLIQCAHQLGILILNGIQVTNIMASSNGAVLYLDGLELHCKQVAICTNGFASDFFDLEVQPARNQVVITKPIQGLNIKGTYHLEQGYYYFRNVGNRLLLGGGRHLDLIGETTTEMNQTENIQSQLEHLLKTVILPKTPFEIEQRWSGILGIGPQKTPIVKEVMPGIFCGVRMGGMGVAIGSLVGYKLAKLMTTSIR